MLVLVDEFDFFSFFAILVLVFVHVNNCVELKILSGNGNNTVTN